MKIHRQHVLNKAKLQKSNTFFDNLINKETINENIRLNKIIEKLLNVIENQDSHLKYIKEFPNEAGDYINGAIKESNEYMEKIHKL